MKVLIKSAFSPFSGYGMDGIGLALALERAGHEVFLQPTHVDPPLPPKIAAMLTKQLRAPFDLLIVHADPGALECTPEMRRAAPCIVAWTMWEYTTLDNLKSRKTLRKRLRNFDGLIAYDTVTAECFRPYLTETTKLVTQQGGFDPAPWTEVTRDWHGERFGFCMLGALSDRKDPFVAIQAFQELKAEHPDEFAEAELHLKTNQPGLHPKMEDWVPKLRVHYDTWPTETVRQFYANMHCLLAPSRGEGKNVPALEMLSTGGTVIATNWGGHTQWLRDEIGYRLNYALRPESARWPECQNARADKDHLKDLMLHVYRNRAEAQHKGTFAADLIPATCSWDAVVEHLFHRLRPVPGGERVYTLSQMVRAGV